MLKQNSEKFQCCYCEYKPYDAQDYSDHLCLDHENEASSMDIHGVPASIRMKVANYFRAKKSSGYESDSWF